MARERTEESTVNLPVLGEEGDTCGQCGSVLAPDQRYCVNCGWRRGDTRVDYQSALATNGVQPAAAAGASARTSPQWNPIFAVGAIGVLGIMLLLGVLIGKDDDGEQVVAASTAPATTTTAATPAPTANTAAAKPEKGDGAAAGQGNVEVGGTGSTEGVQTVDTAALQQATEEGQAGEAGKKLPDQVATGGEPAELDPGGQAGGNDGSPSACVGC